MPDSVPTFAFPTATPVTARIEVVVGAVRLVASDRSDLAVQVDPGGDRGIDHEAAEEVRVDLLGSRLTVRGPKQRWRSLLSLRDVGAVDLTVLLPTGSALDLEGSVVAVDATGPLGDVRVRVGVGDVAVAESDDLRVDTGSGAVTAGTVHGPATVTTGSGAVRVGVVHGATQLKTGNGSTWVGQAAEPLTVKSANGEVVVDRARTHVDVRTANGDLTLGEATSGYVSLQTGHGSIELGVPHGTAALLDVSTSFGRVSQALTPAPGADPDEETVQVHAHTGYGDITVRRAAPVPADPT